MIFNDENIEIEKVEAAYIIRKNSRSTGIDIFAKDGKSISFTFNGEEFDPRQLEKNKTTDIKPYIYWDVDFETKEVTYVFDLTKDKVDLIRLDDNLYNIKVQVENPDMIYSQPSSDQTFKNLIIDTTFSFIYSDNN